MCATNAIQTQRLLDETRYRRFPLHVVVATASSHASCQGFFAHFNRCHDITVGRQIVVIKLSHGLQARFALRWRAAEFDQGDLFEKSFDGFDAIAALCALVPGLQERRAVMMIWSHA